jgi:hypothetical protein
VRVLEVQKGVIYIKQMTIPRKMGHHFRKINSEDQREGEEEGGILIETTTKTTTEGLGFLILGIILLARAYMGKRMMRGLVITLVTGRMRHPSLEIILQMRT